MTFHFDPNVGLYFASLVLFSDTTVLPNTPEPGSLGFMDTGLIGVLGVARRRLWI